MRKTFTYLASTELALLLFGVLCVFAASGTFTESKTVYSSPFFICLLCLLALNLLFCSMKRWHSLAVSTLLLHAGVLITLAGCLMTSFGYVATVNIHEGAYVDEAFRWDIKQDAPLGMQLWIRRINREYYPVPIKIGVLRGEEKYALYTLKTGESFDLDGYRVTPASFDPKTLRLALEVGKGDRSLGIVDTLGTSTLPKGFPYSFKLVKYKDPYLKRIWVDLQLTRGDAVLATGKSEINSPFTWEGLCFYNTQTGTDPTGRDFAGIQIVKDPGRPVVFGGMAIMSVGAVLAFYRRFCTGRFSRNERTHDDGNHI